MTEIEKQALAHINTVRTEFGLEPMLRLNRTNFVTDEVVYRILKQFDQHKRDVSDAVEKLFNSVGHDGIAMGRVTHYLADFILPKPVDPLVEALREVVGDGYTLTEEAKALRAALAKRNAKIVWEAE